MTSLPLLPVFENSTLVHPTNEEGNLWVLSPHSPSFSKCRLLPIIFSFQNIFWFSLLPIALLPSPYVPPSLTSWYQHPLLAGFPCRAKWCFWNPNATVSFPFESGSFPLNLWIRSPWPSPSWPTSLHTHLSCSLPYAFTTSATWNLFLQYQLTWVSSCLLHVV